MGRARGGEGAGKSAHLEVLILLFCQRPLGDHKGAQTFPGHVSTLEKEMQVTRGPRLWTAMGTGTYGIRHYCSAVKAIRLLRSPELPTSVTVPVHLTLPTVPQCASCCWDLAEHVRGTWLISQTSQWKDGSVP